MIFVSRNGRIALKAALKPAPMIVAARLLIAAVGSLVLIIQELRSAPEGYEDEHGFHIWLRSSVIVAHPARVAVAQNRILFFAQP